ERFFGDDRIRIVGRGAAELELHLGAAPAPACRRACDTEYTPDGASSKRQSPHSTLALCAPATCCQACRAMVSLVASRHRDTRASGLVRFDSCVLQCGHVRLVP